MRLTAFAIASLGTVSLALVSPAALAQNAVAGGQTNVLLDLELLEEAAGLALTGASAEVIAPGNLGPDSVAFGITPGTTFEYEDGLASFSGTISHTGTITFNDTVTVGDFNIGFDAGRVDSAAGTSGFFVASTFGGTGLILFDLGTPSSVTAIPGELTVAGDLLVSAEFAGFLGNSALTGADVGDALVQAVPGPGVAAVLAAGGFLTARRRR